MRLRIFAAAAALLFPAIAHAQTPPLTSRAALIQYLDDTARAQTAERRAVIARVHSAQDVTLRQAEVRAKVLDLLGGLPKATGPLNPRTTGRGDGDGFRTENVIFDSMPGQHVTATLFLPKAGNGPFPAVVMAPGHSPAGRQGDYSLAANFARNGVAALTYDIVGEGERLQYYDAEIGGSKVGRPTGEHSMAAFHSWLFDGHVARYFIFDAMRAIDYLQARSEIDASRIGAFGCSGGGTVTAYLAALDERVKAAGVACYANDFDHLLAGPGPQDAEQSLQDFLSSGLDLPDWIELAAPKPYAVISTTEDMFPYAGAKAAVEEARAFWTLQGEGDKFEWITGPGGHGALAPIADKITGFFLRAFAVAATDPVIVPQRPANPQAMLASASGQVGGATIASINQDRARNLARSVAAGPALAAQVRAAARIEAVPGPSRVLVTQSQETRDGLVWTRLYTNSPRGPQELRMVKLATGGAGKAVVILDSTPLDTQGRAGGRLEKLARQGWTVLAVQARGMDGTEEIKSALVGDQNLLALRAFLVGKTLLGLRVDDAIEAVNLLASRTDDKITLLGVGAMGPVALHTAVLDPRIAAVRLENSPVSYRLAASAPLQQGLPAITVPGVLELYDLPDLMAAIAPRPVTLVNTVGPVGQPLTRAQLGAHAPGATVLPYIDDGW